MRIRDAWVIATTVCAIGAMACASDDPPPGGGGNNSGTDASVAVDSGSDNNPSDSGTPTGTDAGAPDTGGIIDECDPIAQTGCPGPRSKCITENTPGAGTRCIDPVVDEIPLGMSCDGRAGECEAGLACVSDGAGAVCRQICNRVDSTGCESLGVDFDCNQQLRGSNWGVCGELPPQCNAFSNAPCGAGEQCGPRRRRNGTFELRCNPAGTRTHNQTCDTGTNRCGVNHVCVRIGTSGVVECRQICEMDDQCPNMGECSGTIGMLQLTYCHP